MSPPPPPGSILPPPMLLRGLQFRPRAGKHRGRRPVAAPRRSRLVSRRRGRPRWRRRDCELRRRSSRDRRGRPRRHSLHSPRRRREWYARLQPESPDEIDGFQSAYDPETSLAACSTGDGTIHIFHEDSPDKISLIQTVKTEFGAKTMALDPKTHNLLVDTSDFDMPGPDAKQGSRPTAKPGTFRLLVYGR